MYELLAEEENIANYVKDYVKHQEMYYTSALREIQGTIKNMDGLFRTCFQWIHEYSAVVTNFRFYCRTE